MDPFVARLRQEREERVLFVSELLEKAQTEQRDLVDAELENVRHARERVEQLDAQIKPLVEFAERRAAAVKLSSAITEAGPRETRSIGAQFVDSPEFQSWVRSCSGRSGTFETRAAGDPFLTSSPGGAALLPAVPRVVVDGLAPTLPLLQMIPTLAVNAPAVQLVVVGDATGADVVAEGAPKPPIEFAVTTKTVALPTVAGWFKASRQSVQDIPGFASMIDQKIRRAIDVKLAAKAKDALLGAIGGGNTTTGEAGASVLDVARLALADFEERGGAPTALLMAPGDRALMDLQLTHVSGVPSVQISPFGIPAYSVPGLTKGTVIVADLSQAISWVHTGGLSMYVTDSDVSDGAAGAVTSDFRRNIITTLGEVRGEFVVFDASQMQAGVVAP